MELVFNKLIILSVINDTQFIVYFLAITSVILDLSSSNLLLTCTEQICSTSLSKFVVLILPTL